MKTLQDLRGIITENFARSLLVPQLAEMNDVMSKALLLTPIANFEEGYKSFIKQIANSPSHYDAWVLTLFDTTAAIGEIKGIVSELNGIVDALRETMPGGEALTFVFDDKDISFLVAFAYRITISLATLSPEQPKEEGDK